MPADSNAGHPIGVVEYYAVNTSASWYHPEYCHSFDHHEWIHAQLARKKESVDGAYEAVDTSRQLYARAVDLLREVYETSQMTPAVHAKVTTFLRGSEWHEALRAFHEGDD